MQDSQVLISRMIRLEILYILKTVKNIFVVSSKIVKKKYYSTYIKMMY